MPKFLTSILPLDLANVVGSFIGDDYHYLTFEFTPVRRWLSPNRMFMQARSNTKRRTNVFRYSDANNPNGFAEGHLFVWYWFSDRNNFLICEKPSKKGMEWIHEESLSGMAELNIN
jgi:hypothetical protein